MMKKQLLTLALLTGFSNVALAALPACKSTADGNFIQNCSFENGVSSEGFNSTTSGLTNSNLQSWLFSSGATLDGWNPTTTSGAADYYAEVRHNDRGIGAAADGNRFLELDTHNNQGGALMQTFLLDANTDYTFSFNWAKRINRNGEVNDFTVLLNNDNMSFISESFDTTDPLVADLDVGGVKFHNWQDFSRTFTTGADGNYSLTFAVGANSVDNFGASIDNVSLLAVAQPVPEPETYAMFLMGLGLLGFAARKQKKS